MLLDIVEDRIAVDPVLLDLRGKTMMTDFFLVCSGTSDVHIRAIADAVLEKSEEARVAKPRIEGQGVGEWVLLDFGDVIVHIMAEEPRARYKLEEFWTTPQPKGALPPTPNTAGEPGSDEDDALDDHFKDDEEEDDEDDDEEDDTAFFAEADAKVEPVDEDDADSPPKRSVGK